VIVESDADSLARPRRVLAADAAVVFAECSPAFRPPHSVLRPSAPPQRLDNRLSLNRFPGGSTRIFLDPASFDDGAIRQQRLGHTRRPRAGQTRCRQNPVYMSAMIREP
jgi:hypothetical protein